MRWLCTDADCDASSSLHQKKIVIETTYSHFSGFFVLSDAQALALSCPNGHFGYRSAFHGFYLRSVLPMSFQIDENKTKKSKKSMWSWQENLDTVRRRSCIEEAGAKWLPSHAEFMNPFTSCAVCFILSGCVDKRKQFWNLFSRSRNEFSSFFWLMASLVWSRFYIRANTDIWDQPFAEPVLPSSAVDQSERPDEELEVAWCFISSDWIYY